MQIVRARAEEAEALSEIALKAKAYWGYPSRWIENWREVLTIQPRFVAAHETYTAWLDGRLVGFYGLVLESGKAQLEHLWVLPEAMGRGIGRALFAHAANRACDLGFTSVEIESDPHAEGFYKRMGARRAGTRVAELEGERRELPILILEDLRIEKCE
jgi:GNAT superfamily N-acetyltransferase